MLLFVYTTTRKRFVIFKCGYFKLLASWNTSALSQSNCRNFSCNSIRLWIEKIHTVSSLQSRRILKREQWYHFQDKCSPAAFPSFLSFFICFQDCGCDQCISEFSLKKKNACSALWVLHLDFWIHHLSVSLDKNLMCQMHLLVSCSFPVKIWGLLQSHSC